MTSPAELPVLLVSVLCIVWLAPKLSVENELLKTRTLGRWQMVWVTDRCRPRLLDMPELFRVTGELNLLLTWPMNLSVRVMLVVVPIWSTRLLANPLLPVVLVVSRSVLCPWLVGAEALVSLIALPLLGPLLQSTPLVMAFPNNMECRGIQLTPLCRVITLQLCMLILLMSIRLVDMLQKCGMRPTSDDPFELAELTNVMARFPLVPKPTLRSTVLCELGQAKSMPSNLMALARLAPVTLVVCPALPPITGLAPNILTMCRVDMLV